MPWVAERARSFVQSSESEDGSLMTKSPVMRIRSSALVQLWSVKSFQVMLREPGPPRKAQPVVGIPAAIMPRVARREQVLIRLGAGMDDFIQRNDGE